MDIITILSAGGTFFAGIAIALSIIAAVAPTIIMIQLSNVNHHLKEIKNQLKDSNEERSAYQESKHE